MKYLAVLLFAGVATALPVGDSEPEAGREKYGPAPVYKPAPIQSELPPRKRQAGYGPPPPVYKPAPVPIAHPEAKLPPQPYQFEYGVADQYTGTNFQAVENQDEKGTVIGSYRVNLPDGRVQTVTYTADHYGGFVADVKYEGEAQYPPEKEYKPAPAPKYAPAPPKYVPA